MATRRIAGSALAAISMIFVGLNPHVAGAPISLSLSAGLHGGRRELGWLLRRHSRRLRRRFVDME